MARTGVKIEGVPYIDYEDAKKWITGHEDNTRFSLRVDEILKPSAHNHETSEIFKPVINNIKKIFNKSLSAAIRTEILPEKFENVNYSKNKDLISLIDEGQVFNALIDHLKKNGTF